MLHQEAKARIYPIYSLIDTSLSASALYLYMALISSACMHPHQGRNWLFTTVQHIHRSKLMNNELERDHSFKYPVIAAAIARYSLLRQGTAICVHVQFSRYIPL
jgi:hypothetical protein